MDRGILMQVLTVGQLRLRLPPCAGYTASTVESVKRRQFLGHERISNLRRGYGYDLE